MLIIPAAIAALLFSLFVGPFYVFQLVQTQRKLLGSSLRQQLSSLRVSFETLPTASVETHTISQVEITSFPILSQDYVEILIPQVTHTQFNDQPSATPTPVFVVVSRCRGPFHWSDLLNYRVFETLAVTFVSFCFPFVAIPFTSKLFSRSETPDEVELPVDEPPKLLSPKYLSPKSVQIRISHRNSDAPLEPILPPAPSKLPPFWLACEYFLISSRPL